MIVGLFGTCAESTWREELIPLLKISYFDPVVKEWTDEAKQNEIKHRQNDDFLLYYFTPRMQGYYAIAELVEDVIKTPSRVIFSFCKNDDEYEFTEKEHNSLKEIGKLIKRNGGIFIESGKISQIAEFLNTNSPRFMKWIKN